MADFIDYLPYLAVLLLLVESKAHAAAPVNLDKIKAEFIKVHIKVLLLIAVQADIYSVLVFVVIVVTAGVVAAVSVCTRL